MRGWLSRGANAALAVADRSEVWVPAALAELVTLGWFPILLAVAPWPSTADIAFAAASFGGRSNLPVLLFALAAAVGCGTLLLRLVAAVADVVVMRELAARSTRGASPESRSLTSSLGAAWGVQVVALLPVVAGLALLAWSLSAAAPAEWQRPDRGGATFLIRTAIAVAPALVAVAAGLLLANAFAAAGMRQVVERGSGFLRAVTHGLGDLRRHGTRAAGLALVSGISRIAFMAASFALLRTLWRPIDAEVAGNPLLRVPGIPLLLGFVFVWLCLAIASGALRAWLTVWWTAELRPGSRARHSVEERGSSWTQRPSSS